MRFVCPEITSEEALLELYYTPKTYLDQIDNGGMVLYPEYSLETETGNAWYFCTPSVKALKESVAKFYLSKTMAEFSAALNIKLTTNLEAIASQTFDWSVKSCTKIQSSYWFTVLAEDGLHLLRPLRRTGAVEIAGTVLTRTKRVDQDIVYDGETGGDFSIGNPEDNVNPATITSTLKILAINKALAKTDQIAVQSSDDASPGDWYNDDGTPFVVLSRAENSDGVYIYICQKESNTTPTISAADIVLTDPWHYVGATGEPAFQNGWQNYHSTSPYLSYRRTYIDGHPVVLLRGDVKNGTLSATVFYFPDGYRPAYNTNLLILGISGSTIYAQRIWIGTTGQVQIVGSTNSIVTLGLLIMPLD